MEDLKEDSWRNKKDSLFFGTKSILEKFVEFG